MPAMWRPRRRSGPGNDSVRLQPHLIKYSPVRGERVEAVVEATKSSVMDEAAPLEWRIEVNSMLLTRPKNVRPLNSS